MFHLSVVNSQTAGPSECAIIMCEPTLCGHSQMNAVSCIGVYQGTRLGHDCHACVVLYRYLFILQVSKGL